MESIIAHLRGFFKLDQNISKTREFLEKSFYLILFILLIIMSFVFGRITKFMESTPTFTFVSREEEEKNFEEEKEKLFGTGKNVNSTSTIVASKNGKKYYFIWCKGAGNLKEANKIYFDTEEQAQKRGLTLASNCN